jgi:hypothetical protein
LDVNPSPCPNVEAQLVPEDPEVKEDDIQKSPTLDHSDAEEEEEEELQIYPEEDLNADGEEDAESERPFSSEDEPEEEEEDDDDDDDEVVAKNAGAADVKHLTKELTRLQSLKSTHSK